MALNGLALKTKFLKYLIPAEKVAAVYCGLTLLLMAVLAPRLVEPLAMLVMRLKWLALTAGLILLSRLLDRVELPASLGKFLSSPQTVLSRCTNCLRVVGQMGWLSVWYPDTYEFNRCFSNLDHLFAQADQSLFGCQPALEFSQAVPQAFWSEAFHLGYWSYFPMIAVLSFSVFFIEWRKDAELPAFNYICSTILTAFFLYYAIYIFLPVAGPQFYYPAVGIDAIEARNFPALGSYFSTHSELLPGPGYSDGLFYRLVRAAHDAGERPTAAFPSSHIGISTILLLLSRRHAPQVTTFLLPFWALLCCATVYIQAHYLVDAIAGLLSAPLILWMAERLNRQP